MSTNGKEIAASHQEAFPSYGRSISRSVPVRLLRSEHERHDCGVQDLDSRLIGESQLMQALKKSIRIVARSAETVLITGESGTGKELIARAVHDLSERRHKPFLPVNCGALTESLLESELFGHMKGSFTGAITNRKGYFESASGGTIFLDEFAEMSLGMQQRLLRVLQEGTIRPVGSTEVNEIEIDSRVVVATNHDLKRDVSEGKFRSDLYYRVNVLELHAPALRHRQEDILPLEKHFIRRYNEKNVCRVSEKLVPEVLAILEAYSWPGNVRELENITKRFALRVGEEGIISEADVRSVPELNQLANPKPLHCVESPAQQQISSPLHCSSGATIEQRQCRCSKELDFYRQLVRQSGNAAEAARQLKIPRSTLRYRMKILENRITPEGF